MGHTPALSRLRRESLPLATIWSFYLHLAGEPKIQIEDGRDFNRRVLIIL